ncbi:MAG: DUF362 domain-containing protein [Deltaproteobacteria bacterium]|nr:DUF362 domain-containing protein [Deltaproteobacteria bacterium]
MSKVFFTDLRTEPKRSLLDKIGNMVERLNVKKAFRPGELIGIKVHFGERGNTAFIRPLLLRPIIEKLLEYKVKPFLTDTNTLYKGSRSDAVSHVLTAIYNGFDYSSTGCPIIIADGLKGRSGKKIIINGEILKEVSIAYGICEADGLFVVTHFKGHELTGFGGALKNLGMGCASREGKLVQHSSVSPYVDVQACKGCRVCVSYCPEDAIEIVEKKAKIDSKKCIGCAECVIVCESKAIKIDFNEPPEVFQKKMVEHAYGVWSQKKGKIFFVNFVLQVSPACDCYPNSDSPIVRDIGILASTDPVALDKASCDLVNEEVSFPKTAIKKAHEPKTDKWKDLYPNVDWEIQLAYAEKLGMGNRTYTLVKI